MTEPLPQLCADINTPRGIINEDVSGGFVSNRKNGLDGPVAELRVVSRGRPPIWRALDAGYAVHPDGRVRDRHRHIVHDVAIIEALLPPKRPAVPTFRLACCGIAVRGDRDTLAAAHWSDCLQDLLAEKPNPKCLRQNLDMAKRYSRDVLPRRAPRRGVMGEPHVLAHNGRTGADRRLRMLPWSAAVRIMLQQKEFSDDLSTTKRAS